MEEVNQYDVVLLQGPKIHNKAAYLPSSIGQRATRDVNVVDLDKLYAENADWGLRDVALHIISLLKQDKQVIVIDEFRQRVTRTSLVNTVKKKVPNCSFLLMALVPEHGFLQVMWTQQQAVLEADPLTVAPPSEMLVKQWFDNSLEHIDYTKGYVSKPSEEEGYAIQTCVLPLQIHVTYKLEVPALILEWLEEEMLVSGGETHHSVMQACLRWSAMNPCGRVIFILTGKMEPGELSCIKTCFKHLSSKMEQPVYAVRVMEPGKTGQFCVPPNPGLLAFLQLRHHLDLLSKNSCLIYKDAKLRTMAESSGLHYLPVMSIMKSPFLVVKSGASSQHPVPAMLKGMRMIARDDDGAHGQIPTVPLFDLRHSDDNQGYISKLHSNGLKEMLFFSDTLLLCRYQDKYASVASLVSDPVSNLQATNVATETSTNVKTHEQTLEVGNKPKKSSRLLPRPKWMSSSSKRPRRESSYLSDTSSLTRSDSSDNSSSRSTKTLYLMSHKEIVAMAKEVMKQAGCDYEPKVTEPD